MINKEENAKIVNKDAYNGIYKFLKIHINKVVILYLLYFK